MSRSVGGGKRIREREWEQGEEGEAGLGGGGHAVGGALRACFVGCGPVARVVGVRRGAEQVLQTLLSVCVCVCVCV